MSENKDPNERLPQPATERKSPDRSRTVKQKQSDEHTRKKNAKLRRVRWRMLGIIPRDGSPPSQTPDISPGLSPTPILLTPTSPPNADDGTKEQDEGDDTNAKESSVLSIPGFSSDDEE